jgi:hypothetical protein
MNLDRLGKNRSRRQAVFKAVCEVLEKEEQEWSQALSDNAAEDLVWIFAAERSPLTVLDKR